MTRELHPLAEEELHDAAHWYGERSIFAGERFVAAIETAFERVCDDPERYQRIGDGVQVYRLDRFPFKVLYEYDAARQHVRFLCVMHNRRAPDYWKERLGGGK